MKTSTLFLILCFLHGVACNAIPSKQSYIVYMGAHSHPLDATEEHFNRATDYHHQFLSSYVESYEEAKNAIIYSYNKHINGFAAFLDEHQVEKIKEHPEVISVFPNKAKELHTTYSWEFMNLEDNNGVVGPTSAWTKTRFGEDTIIGNIDTGVWSESKSFNDDGLGPVPSRWKGTCQQGSNVTCNRKLIGARYFNKGFISVGGKIPESDNNARDYEGHGTHTLSTAGGSFVPGANIFGAANGTAKGGAPKARVAVYKACWNGGRCHEADIIASFDMAIHDGVDVLSVSIGDSFPSTYWSDGTAIGSFHAAQNGIVVVCSAGNSGFFFGVVANTAPWMITVAASNLDRDFVNSVQLQNGLKLKGTSLSPGLPDDKQYPLVGSIAAKAANASYDSAVLCYDQTLDPTKVKGKIVLCLNGLNPGILKGMEAKRAGAVGMIIYNDKNWGNVTDSDPHVLPTSHLNLKNGDILWSYINSSAPNEVYASISSPTPALHEKTAPVMAHFSCQGPNLNNPEILKPDITAPGVNIIAAFSEAGSPTAFPADHRRASFMVSTGTSMSTPHVAGVAGLLKTLHPDWSPAAIRSAIMTSARTRDNTLKPIKNEGHVKADPLDYGAGHLRPNKAVDPGLVYDLSNGDYMDVLCAMGFSKTRTALFTNATHQCPEPGSQRANLINFNYPAITVPKFSGTVSLTRRVKNVGPPATYTSRIHHPIGVHVTVDPTTLKFERVGEVKSFNVTLTLKASRGHFRSYASGRLTWTDGSHFVRSPIVVSP